MLIPIERLLIFSNDREGVDVRGRSLLRSAYKPFYFKRGLERVAAIAAEKRGVGVDVGTLKGSDVDTTRRSKAEDALMTMRAHERNYLIETESGFSYRVEGITGEIVDPMPQLDYHARGILMSVLAEFLMVGTGGSGSFALVRDKTSFFLMALAAVADNVSETFNRHLFPRWGAYNWAGVEEWPRLRYSRLDTRDVQSFANAVDKLAGAGALHLHPGDEDAAREVLDLPPRDPERDPAKPDTSAEPPAPPTPPEQGPEAEAEPGDEQAEPGVPVDDLLDALGVRPSASLSRARDIAAQVYGDGCGTLGADLAEAPSLAERLATRESARKIADAGLVVRFAEIERTLDEGVERIIEDVGKVQRQQVKALTKVAGDILGMDDNAAAIKRLRKVSIPRRAQLAQAVEGVLADVYREGKREALAELRAQRQGGTVTVETLARLALEVDPSDDESVVEYLAERALALSFLLAERIKSTFVWAMLDIIGRGQGDADDVERILFGLSEREATKLARGTVSEANGFGRDAAARESGARLAIYSSVLDAVTCSPCGDNDGREVEVDSNEYGRLTPPYVGCFGRGKCRCTWVFVLDPRRVTR